MPKKNSDNNYISLQEATKYCDYSQEYLSLRARQGKLRAVKFGRNWVTKKEWVEEYLGEIERYNNKDKIKKFILPPEGLPIEGKVEKLWDPSYLEKLEKSKEKVLKVKLGFFVAFVFILLITTSVLGKESIINVYRDLSPRVERISEQFDNNIGRKTSKNLSKLIVAFKEYTQWLTHQSLVVGKKSISSIVGSSVSVIKRSTSGVDYFIRTSTSNGVQGYYAATKIIKNKVRKTTFPTITFPTITFPTITFPTITLAKLTPPKIVLPQITLPKPNLSKLGLPKLAFPKLAFPKLALPKLALPKLALPKITLPKITLIAPLKITLTELTLLEPYLPEFTFVVPSLPDFGSQMSATSQKIVQAYISVDEFVGKTIFDFGQTISKDVGVLRQSFTDLKQFIVKSWISPTEKTIVSEITEKEIEELKTEIKKLKEEGLTAKEIIKEIEVSKVTKIEPIKEITKEIIKVDEEELAKLKTQIAQFSLWGADIEALREITKKLQAYPTYTPVPSAPIYVASQGIQVGGHGSFASLGVSGLAGIGDLGVGESTSLGSDSSDELSVNATSTFRASVTAEAGLSVGTGPLTIDSTGNLSTPGTIAATGGITEAGIALSNKYIAIPSSSAQGDILYYDSSNWERLAAGTVGQYLQTQGTGADPVWAGVVSGLWTNGGNITYLTATSDDLAVGGSTSAAPLFMDVSEGHLTVQRGGDAKLTIYSNTDVPTANAKLLVLQKGTTPSELFSVDEDGDVVINGSVGIGTTGPDRKLDVLDASSPQFRLTQADGTVYTEFQVAATTGDLTILLDPGEDITLAGTGSSTGANLWVCKGSSCPTFSLDDDGSLFVEEYAYFAGDKIKYPSELGRPKRTIILTAAGAIVPATNGAAQTKNEGTNFTYYTLDFDSSTDESAYWEFVVPDSFDNSTNCNVYIHWTASSGTVGHGVSWKIASLGRTDDEVLDSAVVNEVEIEDAMTATNDIMVSGAGSLNDDWNVGEFAVIKVYRDVDAYVGSNLSADAKLLQVKIEYSVTQESD